MTDIPIKIIRSRRRTLAIEVREGGEVIVRAPLYSRKAEINAFVKAHENWIITKYNLMITKQNSKPEHVFRSWRKSMPKNLTGLRRSLQSGQHTMPD